jgi:hypothetical protein
MQLASLLVRLVLLQLFLVPFFLVIAEFSFVTMMDYFRWLRFTSSFLFSMCDVVSDFTSDECYDSDDGNE